MLRCIFLFCVKVFGRYVLYMAFLDFVVAMSLKVALRYVALRFAVMCCVVLRCIALCCIALYCVVMRRAALRFAVLC